MQQWMTLSDCGQLGYISSNSKVTYNDKAVIDSEYVFYSMIGRMPSYFKIYMTLI